MSEEHVEISRKHRNDCDGFEEEEDEFDFLKVYDSFSNKITINQNKIYESLNNLLSDDQDIKFKALYYISTQLQACPTSILGIMEEAPISAILSFLDNEEAYSIALMALVKMSKCEKFIPDITLFKKLENIAITDGEDINIENSIVVLGNLISRSKEYYYFALESKIVDVLGQINILSLRINKLRVWLVSQLSIYENPGIIQILTPILYNLIDIEDEKVSRWIICSFSNLLEWNHSLKINPEVLDICLDLIGSNSNKSIEFANRFSLLYIVNNDDPQYSNLFISKIFTRIIAQECDDDIGITLLHTMSKLTSSYNEIINQIVHNGIEEISNSMSCLMKGNFLEMIYIIGISNNQLLIDLLNNNFANLVLEVSCLDIGKASDHFILVVSKIIILLMDISAVLNNYDLISYLLHNDIIENLTRKENIINQELVYQCVQLLQHIENILASL